SCSPHNSPLPSFPTRRSSDLNCLDFVETLFGALLVGIPVLTINARFKTRELAHVLDEGDLVAVVTSDLVADYVDYAALLESACRSEEHTSELQSRGHLVCRLL